MLMKKIRSWMKTTMTFLTHQNTKTSIIYDAPQPEKINIATIYSLPTMNKKKYNLEENGNHLNLYFFTIQKGKLPVEVPEEAQAYLAYDDLEALNTLRSGYGHIPKGELRHIRKRANISIPDLLQSINIPGDRAIPTPVVLDSSITSLKVEPSSKSKEISKQQFVYNTLLVADKYIESDRDKKTIKRILEKIEIKHELAS